MRAAFVLLVLVLLVAAFAVEAPATLLDRRIEQATGGVLRLGDARGTVWSGRGTLADARGRWRLPLGWRSDPVALFTGRLAVTLVPASPDEPRGTVTIGEQELGATDLALRLPAGIIESAWPGNPAPRFDGRLVVTAPSWRRVGARMDGALDARWEDARVSFGGLAVSLGTVDATARPADGAVTRVALRNRGGDVAIDGEAIVQDDGVRLDARLTPAPTLAAPLAMIVRSLGTVEPDGRVHVTWQARR
jgi:general secretion pathway protein N